MGNSRGTKYSKNTRVADNMTEAYWDFDFTDMGMYDVPAFLHTIISVDKGELEMYKAYPFEVDPQLYPYKVSFVGYDIGNMQMFYALTQLTAGTFMKDINFIAMAPCIFKKLENGNTEVSFSLGVGRYRYLGVCAVNGPNWVDDLNKICSLLDENACKEAQRFAEPGIPISTKNLEYIKQLAEQQRYQVYAKPADYIA